MYDGESASGVNKKIFSQIQSLNQLGVDAKLILIGNTRASEADPLYVIHAHVPSAEMSSIFTRILRSRKIAGIIRDCIKELGPRDVLYIRYPLMLLFCPFNFFKPFRKCRLVFEHNAVLMREFLLNREYLYLFLEFIFGNIVLFQADGGIAVTEEYMDYVRKRIGGRNTPLIANSNGISVDSVRLRTPRVFVSDQEISILCVATFYRWHAIDRLILGLARYSGQCSVTLHLVGGGPMITNLKQLCIHHNLVDRVIFHGFLSGPDLDRLFDESHIAVDTVGQHRLKLSISNSLKAREYCARGIPFMMASADPDFPDDFPYILKIPKDETFVDLEKVIIFVNRVCLDPDHPQKMRQYAVKHLDWLIKMKKTKTFLEERIIEN